MGATDRRADVTAAVTTGAVTIGDLRAAKLGRDFYLRDARAVARALLGAYLVHAPRGTAPRAVRIVETEAYCGPKDLACHARVGLTRRTRTLLGEPGHAYVFLIYGMHECFNVTCLREGAGHAVLVRGGEPVLGIEQGVRADGPGRLSRALGLTRSDDARDLTGDALFLAGQATPERVRVGVTARVGVAYAGTWADKPWRYFDATSAGVSRPSAKTIGRGPRD
jgi:DNA-3-methyladenine glycosylase